MPLWITFLITGTGNNEGVYEPENGGIWQDVTSEWLSAAQEVSVPLMLPSVPLVSDHALCQEVSRRMCYRIYLLTVHDLHEPKPTRCHKLQLLNCSVTSSYWMSLSSEKSPSVNHTNQSNGGLFLVCFATEGKGGYRLGCARVFLGVCGCFTGLYPTLIDMCPWIQSADYNQCLQSVPQGSTFHPSKRT